MSEPRPAADLPLAGIRVLALEQMQALPYATQMLARLGADVVKIEPIGRGDSGRSSTPTMVGEDGRAVGATFLRNNLFKRSLCVDLRSPAGRELVLRLAPGFDVVAENSKAGSMARLGLAYDDIAAVHPSCVYVSVSGFGNTVPTPYASWPAYAPIAEAMSGIYEMRRVAGERPRVLPVGALGDVSAALYAVIGTLSALRHRQVTGRGQYVDVAMLDSVVAMTDIVMNLWSMGLRDGSVGAVIVDTFRAADGWFVLQVAREEQFNRLCELIGRPDWRHDARFATREQWVTQLEPVIRPAVEAWVGDRTRIEACQLLTGAGLAAGPCYVPGEVVDDQHLRARNMVIELERTDGVAEPVLVPGIPFALSEMPNRGGGRVPFIGEHSDEILRDELGCTADEIRDLRADGVIG